MRIDQTPLAMYRTKLPTGCSWNLLEPQDRWALDARVLTAVHGDGLLAVERAVEELALMLDFAVDLRHGREVVA